RDRRGHWPRSPRRAPHRHPVSRRAGALGTSPEADGRLVEGRDSGFEIGDSQEQHGARARTCGTFDLLDPNPESPIRNPGRPLVSGRRYFGTDGIRGRVGQWPITAEFMLKLGRAMGSVLASRVTGAVHVVIGKDTRISGYMFESALEAGLVAAGANVSLLGPVPTPAVAYFTRSLRASAGIVISA